MSISALENAKHVAEPFWLVVTRASRNATNAKPSRTESSFQKITELVDKSVADLTQPVAIHVRRSVMMVVLVQVVMHLVKLLAVIPSATRSAQSLVLHVLKKLALQHAFTSNVQCLVQVRATGYPVREDVRRSWRVVINVSQYTPVVSSLIV